MYLVKKRWTYSHESGHDDESKRKVTNFKFGHGFWKRAWALSFNLFWTQRWQSEPLEPLYIRRLERQITSAQKFIPDSTTQRKSIKTTRKSNLIRIVVIKHTIHPMIVHIFKWILMLADGRLLKIPILTTIATRLSREVLRKCEAGVISMHARSLLCCRWWVCNDRIFIKIESPQYSSPVRKKYQNLSSSSSASIWICNMQLHLDEMIIASVEFQFRRIIALHNAAIIIRKYIWETKVFHLLHWVTFGLVLEMFTKHAQEGWLRKI